MPSNMPLSMQGAKIDSAFADCPIGEIQLGTPPAMGQRARALAGLMPSGSAAMFMQAAGQTDTGTSHSGPA
ncbi:hypothetical protein GCM10027290_37050 [Micromonospora sonneratiae]|jgi:hypothetical protein|uniref:FXSXX-COOH protein n=1 Tax=Micromonospora sonneratiae TaxID=1184706 RepID=A0ABW3YFG4_9ACTN